MSTENSTNVRVALVWVHSLVPNHHFLPRIGLPRLWICLGTIETILIYAMLSAGNCRHKPHSDSDIDLNRISVLY